jgi:hypothetical protein
MVNWRQIARSRPTAANEEDHPMANVPSYPGTPRWVIVFAIIVAVPAMVFVIHNLAGWGLRGHMH